MLSVDIEAGPTLIRADSVQRPPVNSVTEDVNSQPNFFFRYNRVYNNYNIKLILTMIVQLALIGALYMYAT